MDLIFKISIPAKKVLRQKCAKLIKRPARMPYLIIHTSFPQPVDIYEYVLSLIKNIFVLPRSKNNLLT